MSSGESRPASGDARDKMKNYWQEHSGQASVVEMMLDNDAAKISERDIEDVKSMVPEMKGKRILELGAGIGRYTGWLAEHSEHVVAIDFIEKFIEKNRQDNQHHKNVEFRCADATKLEFPPNSFDIVFSNWLLMYLTDEETFKLLQNVLSWLTPGGYLFFRESCNKPSGNKRRGDNPTIYRKLGDYDNLLNSVTMPDPTDADPNHALGFELLLVRSNQAYVDIKKNPFQLCWLAQKTSVSTNELHGCRSLHEFLDKRHYTKKDIAKFDLLLGRRVLLDSTSGDSVSEEPCPSPVPSGNDTLLVSTARHLNLKADEEVLEVGCGSGWGAFYLAEEYGVKMYAIDLSANMIERALEHFDSEYKHHDILFEMADATQRNFGENRFDAIYCRDTLSHIREKSELFDKFFKWLKPNGRLCIANLCRGKAAPEAELLSHLAERHYHLLTTVETEEMLSNGGFSQVQIFNESENMKKQLEDEEMAAAKRLKKEFVARFSEQDHKTIVHDITSKLRWLNTDQLEWIVVSACKPNAAACLTPPKTPVGN